MSYQRRTFERRIGGAPVRIVAALTCAVGVWGLTNAAAPAVAAGLAHSTSRNVALIPGATPVPANGPDGVMPTSSSVTGRPSESFSQFTFSDLPLSAITPGKLARFDTVALIQTKTSSLTTAQKSALAGFVANGGKLIIHDSDETKGNDYSWLLRHSSVATVVGLGCNNCGSSSGSSTIKTNSGIISANPADRSYVSLAELQQFTDQGDANLLVSTDPSWFVLVQGTNGRGEAGAQVAFAVSTDGVIIYNGFDTDFIKSTPSDPWRCNEPSIGYRCLAQPAPQPTVDWLGQMWYSELAQGWGPSTDGGGSNLPTSSPLVAVGTPQQPGAVGLPSRSVGRCARRSVLLRLRRLQYLHHRHIVQVDIYVNRRHALRMRRPFRNIRLTALPRHSAFTLTEVATTNRGFHFIAKHNYRRC